MTSRPEDRPTMGLEEVLGEMERSEARMSAYDEATLYVDRAEARATMERWLAALRAHIKEDEARDKQWEYAVGKSMDAAKLSEISARMRRYGGPGNFELEWHDAERLIRQWAADIDAVLEPEGPVGQTRFDSFRLATGAGAAGPVSALASPEAAREREFSKEERWALEWARDALADGINTGRLPRGLKAHYETIRAMLGASTKEGE